MIATLRGTLASLGKSYVVIQVGGVGFQVFCPKTLLEAAGAIGDEMEVYTHLHVRENELTLYGCATEEELALFRLLQTVSGIGPRAALSALSALPAEELRQAIAGQDVLALSRIPGIGRKTAEKLVLELKDKVAAEVPGLAPRPALTPADADLIAALTGLGYSVAEIQEAIRALPREAIPLEERVRRALGYLGSM